MARMEFAMISQASEYVMTSMPSPVGDFDSHEQTKWIASSPLTNC